MRAGRRWWVLSVALVALGAGLLALGLHAQLDSPEAGGPAPPTLVAPTPPGGPSSATKTGASPSAPRALPVELRIPAIHLSVAVGRLGLNPDGTVEVPANPARPGWYRFGAAPGEVGSAVMLGHVDSTSGPAVFYLLSGLKPKDAISVLLSNGSVSNFTVSGVEVYQGDQFPNHRVYGSHGYSALQLVTCGGGFDTQTQHYLGNVVIYSTLVSITPPPG